MIDRIEAFLRRSRRKLHASEALVRLLGLSRSGGDPARRGLILIQIDALSRNQLQRALDEGRMPFLQSLIERQRYKVHLLYPGQPGSTPVVQAELFYGVRGSLPSFSYYDHTAGRHVQMFTPDDALEVERRLARRCEPLLSEGSAYSDIFSGGADEAHFCVSHMGFAGMFRRWFPLGYLLLMLMQVYSLVRMAAFFLVELVLSVYDFFAGIRSGRDFLKELKFMGTRAAMTILLREFVVMGVTIDAARGMPIVHANFMGYHEQSHRRGASSRFAHWTLGGIDYAVRRIWRAARASGLRDYDVWIYSDHGQQDTVPYRKATGQSIYNAVAEVCQEAEAPDRIGRHHPESGFFMRIGLYDPSRRKHREAERLTREKSVITTALGPVAHVYLADEGLREHIDDIRRRLMEEKHIPIIWRALDDQRIRVWTREAEYLLPQDAEAFFDPGWPYFDEMVRDFMHVYAGHPDVGDLVLCGYQGPDKPYYSFAVENGSHGGIGGEETRGFALTPNHVAFEGAAGYIRPLQLRRAAMEVLGRGGERVACSIDTRTGADTFRIMTYNVHSCIGMDGRLSPSRIARVIAQFQPHIVALQELDVGRRRTLGHDQARLIADHLNMDLHFHPALRFEEEQYGDAILSTLPLRLIKSGPLPGLPGSPHLEPRGALWVEVRVDGCAIHVVNTHLGLRRRERLAQIHGLLGPDWLEHPDRQGPAILCGDFNAFPNSEVHHLCTERLLDVQVAMEGHRPRGTWFGRRPFIRIDHIFITPDLEVRSVGVGDTELARIGSDHRPLVADVRLRETGSDNSA